MLELQTFDHDVLVIGAGGAGLRAAIEAAARGVSVGLVCKSLLGKAHTVMAEGGVAAALGNWTIGTTGCPFHRYNAGGQYATNGAWRVARPGVARAGARARGLGRPLRPHRGRADPPAQLRGASLPPAGTRGRSHRAGDDPHPPGPRHSSGHRRPYGGDGRHPVLPGGPHCGSAGLRSGAGPAPALPRPGRGDRDRRCGTGVQDHQQQLGVHRRRPVAGAPGRRDAPDM